MPKSVPFADCTKSTCFAHFEGKCMCLTNNKFKGNCPFYKTTEENKQQAIKVKERLERIGFMEAAKSKYGGMNYELE